MGNFVPAEVFGFVACKWWCFKVERAKRALMRQESVGERLCWGMMVESGGGNESLINSKKLRDQKVDLVFQPWKQWQN
jgi:hypothetical protein